MAGSQSKKRKAEEGMKRKPKAIKKFKKQTDYDNQSSESEAEPTTQDFAAVNLQDSDDELDAAAPIVAGLSDDDEPAIDDVEESEVTDGSNSDSEDQENSDSETESNPNLIRKRKRNDPDAFATSMAKILGSKLSTSRRSDPVLARSASAIQDSKEHAELALERKAKSKLREERKLALEKGRVKDVLGASTAFDAANGKGEGSGQTVQAKMMEEKAFRKTAQRGVVHLFNAVRAAQVKGEQAARESREKGVVGHGRREEKVNEMSKKGFLELIAGGGNTNA
jgi:hypothetical protein